MLSGVESAESKQPLDGCDEDELERNKKSMEENHNGVGLDGVDFLIRVIVQIVCIDQEVTSKYSRETKTEEETLEINNSLSKQNHTAKESEPLEEISIRDGTGKSFGCTFSASC